LTDMTQQDGRRLAPSGGGAMRADKDARYTKAFELPVFAPVALFLALTVVAPYLVAGRQ